MNRRGYDVCQDQHGSDESMEFFPKIVIFLYCHDSCSNVFSLLICEGYGQSRSLTFIL